jgi:hypothetical protein
MVSRFAPSEDGVDQDLCDYWRGEDNVLAQQVASLLREVSLAKQPAPLLNKALKADNLYTRMAAALALARIAPGHPGVGPTLLQILEKRVGLFYYICDTLTSLGKSGKAAVPFLDQILQQEDHEVYLIAKHALLQIDPEAWYFLPCARGPLSARRDTALEAMDRSKTFDAAWSELESTDPCKAYQAIGDLILLGNRVVPLLQQRVSAIAPVPREKIEQLVNDLDASRFDMRNKASMELARIIEQAEPVLRKVLAGRPSLELLRRAELLLENRDPLDSPERRHNLRALVVLEHLGTPEACRVLHNLAQGAPEALLTNEARAALSRLAQ